jgi:hypothetical protein
LEKLTMEELKQLQELVVRATPQLPEVEVIDVTEESR